MNQPLRFTLPRATPVLNSLLRMHHHARRKLMQGLAWEVKAATQGHRPATPLPRAKVTIVRYGLGMPDRDGLVGGCKLLLDTLVSQGPTTIRGGQPVCRHPYGLGIIEDDSPAHCTLEVSAVRVGKKADVRTEVTVEEMP